MDFSHFDARKYPTVGVEEGYSEWAATYEDIVMDAMDLRLLGRIQSVAWQRVSVAADLACGTGRIGMWLTQHGVGAVDGVDLTAAMLDGARAKGVYRQLFQADVRATPLPIATYDLVSVVLADEHLSAVAPLYAEAARITRPGGQFVLVGYHPFFMLSGIPTHFNQASGEPATIECYVHLFSDHVAAALANGWTLREMHEGLIDDDWLAVKPKWVKYANRPVSYALVWEKQL
ncbi:MAG TPA: class I SAM-dependent methyltransferase [Ktedonobacterales bacterium]